MVAAFLAHSPAVAFMMALLLVAVTCLGAGIPFESYLRVSAAPLLFLLVSGETLAVSVGRQGEFPWLCLNSSREQFLVAQKVAGRSQVSLAALLFFAMTTPLNDLIALLRRIGFPSVLTDLMALCYRTLSVFVEAIHDITTAQSSRLGFATPRLALRSLGIMIASLTVQIWQRCLVLHQAALSRANDDPLCFFTSSYPAAAGSLIASLLAGCALIALAVVRI